MDTMEHLFRFHYVIRIYLDLYHILLFGSVTKVGEKSLKELTLLYEQ